MTLAQRQAEMLERTLPLAKRKRTRIETQLSQCTPLARRCLMNVIGRGQHGESIE